MKKPTTLCAIAMLSGFISHSAQAVDFLKAGPSVFNYNHADLAFQDDNGANGTALRFSADFKENYAFRIHYQKLSDSSFDADTISGSVTYHIQSNRYPRADWVMDVGITSSDTELVDDTGLHLRAGTRYALNDSLELNGMLAVETVFDTDISLNLQALYEVASGLSGLLETRFGDDPSLGLGLRFYWR